MWVKGKIKCDVQQRGELVLNMALLSRRDPRNVSVAYRNKCQVSPFVNTHLRKSRERGYGDAR